MVKIVDGAGSDLRFKMQRLDERRRTQLEELDARIADFRRDDQDLTSCLVELEDTLPMLMIGQVQSDCTVKESSAISSSQLPLGG